MIILIVEIIQEIVLKLRDFMLNLFSPTASLRDEQSFQLNFV